jgi:hypothetical protein
MSDDPLLSAAEAANVLGCDEHGVFVLVKHELLPFEPERYCGRNIHRFRRSAVEAVRPTYRRLRDFQEKGFHDHPERGRECSLLWASEHHGIPLYRLRKAIKDGRLPAEDLKPCPTGSKPWKIVLEKNVLALDMRTKLQERDSARLNRDRWKTATEVQRSLVAEGLNGDEPSDRAEVSACIRCWTELGKLACKEATVRVVGMAPGSWRQEGDDRVFENLRPVEKVRKLRVYDYPQFKKLWGTDFATEGARRLKQLLAEHNNRCPARTVVESLWQLGVAGYKHRDRVARKANARVIRDSGRRAGRGFVYVLRNGAPARSPKDIMKSILRNGPIEAGEGLRKAEEAGLTTNQVYAALKELQVPLKSQASRVGAHLWMLPGSPVPPQAPERETRLRPPIVRTPLQEAILAALDGRSMVADDLEFKLRVDRRRLYYGGTPNGRGGLKELLEREEVLSGKGKGIRGYFRPDCPPPK